MKVVFINPWSQDEENVKWNPDYHTHYWRNAYFGLVQIATFTRSLGHEVTIIGASRTCIDRGKCLESFMKTMGCSVCFKICPFSKGYDIYERLKAITVV